MFHFSDDDLFPFPCPSCGHKITETVGRLKAHADLNCPECKVRIWYYPESFQRALDEAERAMNDFGRDIRFGEQDS